MTTTAASQNLDGADAGGPLKDRLFGHLEEFSPAERKVARVLISRYPAAGLQSAASLAKEARTSTPTVLRLVSRLGLDGYPEFQRRLRDEVTETMSSPVSRARRHLVVESEDSALSRAIDLRLRLVERLRESVPPGEFERAVTLLAGRSRGVTVIGGYFSRLIARMLAMQLDQLIPGVAYADEPLGRDVGAFLAMSKDSILIALDLRRHETSSKEAIALAKARGATVVLVTDESLSPSAEEADVVLPVAVDGVPFDSFSALVTLVECLVDAVFRTLGARAIERMSDWEQSVHIHRAFRAVSDSSAEGTDIHEHN